MIYPKVVRIFGLILNIQVFNSIEVQSSRYQSNNIINDKRVLVAVLITASSNFYMIFCPLIAVRL